MSGVDVSKVVAYGLIGPTSGVTVSKVVAYVLLQPGTEAGATAPKHNMHTYGQILDQPNPVGAR